MLDLVKTKEHFLALSHDQQLQELTSIFERIKDKNENCGYIYGMLTNRQELFDDDLIKKVFVEVLEVYDRIHYDNLQIAHQAFSGVKQRIESLHQREQQERKEDNPDDLLKTI